MNEHEQFPLPLRIAEEAQAQEFYRTDANGALADAVRSWADSPFRPENNAVILTGAANSGKTALLRHINRDFTQYSANALPLTLPFCDVCVIDAIDRVADESQLFHILNAAKETGVKIMMVGREVPLFSLPDLASRIAACKRFTMPPPDVDLLTILLTERFAARQLRPSPAAVSYVAKRIERRYGAAEEAVRKLDEASLARGVPVSHTLAKETFGWR